jgi:putative ABC transport system permease protein
MNWRQHVRSHLPPLSVSAERESDIVDELALQLEATYERARAQGASETDAVARALAEVPDWQTLARTLGRIERPHAPSPAPGAGSGGPMTGIVQDLRYAARALVRAPGFAAISIVTLALGIAATTIVYSLVDGILLRPLPIHQPERVMLTRETTPTGQDMSLAWPNFEDWKKRQTSFEHFAGWRGLPANLTGIDQPRRINVRHMTWDMLTTLGVRPILGRDFTADDDQYGVERTAIVSYAFWQTDLGGTPDAIGRRIMLDETSVTVIGVLPREFAIARDEAMFLPWGSYLVPKSFMFGRGNHFGLAAIARLKPGVTVEAARAEMSSIARQLAQEYPATNSGNGATLVPFFEVLVRDARPMLYVLTGAVLTMLLIACVNLANLMLARAAGRTQEMAVRRSLGAARWRLARQMLTESVLLALLGGAAGVALAYVGLEALVALLPPTQPRVHLIAIDGRVLAISAVVTILTGLLFGLVPAIQAATGRSMSLLRGARVTGTAQTSAGTRRALLLAEVALALVLVTGAGLMLRTMNNLLAVDPGFDGEQLISAQFNLPARYDAPKRIQFYDRAVERLRALPGVTHAAFTYSLPLAGSNWNSIFIVEGQPVPERSQLPSSAWTPITKNYFETMGIRLLRGRLFEDTDATGAPDVVIVNETFARRFFGDNDPIGTRVKQGWPEDKTPWRQIVGVVNDVRVASLQGDPTLQIYIPVRQAAQSGGVFVVRAATAPAALTRAMESAIHEIDPNLPLFNVRTMDQVLEAGIGNERLTMVLLAGFAALALLMAAIGVFGVTAYTVSQRTHEVGIRMALGAKPGSVLAMVLRQEMSACLIGIAAGLVGAVLLSSLLESLLFGIPPRDAVTLSGAAVVLLVVTAVACIIPARRATRVDPATALRLE